MNRSITTRKFRLFARLTTQPAVRPNGPSVIRMTVVCITCLSALAMLGLPAAATAQEVLVVSPAGLDNLEGDSLGFSGGFIFQGGGARLQSLHPSSDFSELPAGHNTIVAMAFRPDHTVTAPRTTTVDNFELWLSTTSVAPGRLSPAFADNHGNDQTRVYFGPLQLHTDGAGGPAEGPRPFDYIIEFQVPFVYDPSQGNLLIDTTYMPPIGDSPPAFDNQKARPDSLNQTRIARPASATVADLSFAEVSVAQFTFVPEPSTFVLAAFPLLAFLGWRQKKPSVI